MYICNVLVGTLKLTQEIGDKQSWSYLYLGVAFFINLFDLL